MTETNEATFKECIALSLEKAAAVIEYVRAQVEARRDALDTALVDWSEAALAESVAEDLVYLAAAFEYTPEEPEEATRLRVLREALAALRKREATA